VPSRQAKNALFEAIASFGKAFASARRLELLDLLSQGPRTVEELARASDQSAANTSQHLQSLHAAGLVTRERRGLSVRYELADDTVAALWLSLRDVAAERLAEVERAAGEYLGGPVEAIARSDLERRLEGGNVVLIDVRPAEEFDAGHIEGALSIPIDELEARMDELPDDVELVAYCRGPFCVFASDAVRRLRASGRAARRLEVGWPEWRLGESTRRPAGLGA
jgi:rhodanese-related sulfurtransferase